MGNVTKSKHRPVVKLDTQNNLIEIYPSLREAARCNYMSHQTIMDYCNGKCKREIAPGGFKYKWNIGG